MDEYEVCGACDGTGYIEGEECAQREGWGEFETLAQSLDENWVHDSDMEDR